MFTRLEKTTRGFHGRLVRHYFEDTFLNTFNSVLKLDAYNYSTAVNDFVMEKSSRSSSRLRMISSRGFVRRKTLVCVKRSRDPTIS